MTRCFSWSEWFRRYKTGSGSVSGTLFNLLVTILCFSYRWDEDLVHHWGHPFRGVFLKFCKNFPWWKNFQYASEVVLSSILKSTPLAMIVPYSSYTKEVIDYVWETPYCVHLSVFPSFRLLPPPSLFLGPLKIVVILYRNEKIITPISTFWRLRFPPGGHRGTLVVVLYQP